MLWSIDLPLFHWHGNELSFQRGIFCCWQITFNLLSGVMVVFRAKALQ